MHAEDFQLALTFTFSSVFHHFLFFLLIVSINGVSPFQSFNHIDQVADISEDAASAVFAEYWASSSHCGHPSVTK